MDNVVTVDTTAPVISVTNPEITTVAQGAVFTDPGATAEDALDGVVTVVTGGDTVDSSAAVGTEFSITYSATDSLGNSNQATRTVTVTFVDSTPPVITVTNPGLTWMRRMGPWPLRSVGKRSTRIPR